MHTHRLTTLAKFLRTVPEKKFDLTSWRDSHRTTDDELRDPTCNTAACAVGWACSLPEFKAEGLGFKGGPYQSHGELGNTYGWPAVREFFFLDSEQANYLFDFSSYERNNATDVADRIDKFVKQRQREAK